MKDFLDRAVMQNSPLFLLEKFLNQEKSHELSNNWEKSRLVGYVLEIGYNTATIITSDALKIAVGGVPRNSLLIMAPDNYKNLPLHFTVLGVIQEAVTPLSEGVEGKVVQQYL